MVDVCPMHTSLNKCAKLRIRSAESNGRTKESHNGSIDAPKNDNSRKVDVSVFDVAAEESVKLKYSETLAPRSKVQVKQNQLISKSMIDNASIPDYHLPSCSQHPRHLKLLQHRLI